jgi:single-strand DNA-binding protein
MANFNKVIIAGNLTRDPELRYTSKGTAVAGLSMALNRKWKNDSGEMQEEVTFVDVDAFGRQAEVIAQYMKKGRPLLVEGRLRLDQWEDKQTGARRSQLRVVLDSFSFIDSGGGGGGGGGGRGETSDPFAQSAPTSKPAAPQPSPNQPTPDQSPPAQQSGGLPDDDDVPF